MNWTNLSQQVKQGFKSFQNKTNSFFTQIGNKIRQGSEQTAQYLNIPKKLDLIRICERDKSNIPLFIIKSAKIIIKNIKSTDQNIFRLSGSKEIFDKCLKELEISQNVQELDKIDPIIVCQLFKKFYAMLSPMILEIVAHKLKSINNNLKIAVDILNELHLHYKYNCVFLLRFLLLASQKVGENQIESLAVLMQPVLIPLTEQNAKDEDVKNAIIFFIKYADELATAVNIDCNDFIAQIQNIE